MMRVGFCTLGCKVSQYETEAIADAFRGRGYTVCDFSSACDVYVINTCTVTAEADRKSRQMIRRAIAKNPRAVVLVCGCYSQRSPESVAAIEGVSGVIGSSGKLGLVDMAEQIMQHGGQLIHVTDVDSEPFEPMCITGGSRTRVYVKIEDGCESKCTYCAIPSARGRVRSKPWDDVIREVEALAESGVYEVVLTGIETGPWGRDLPGKPTLGELIAELDRRGKVGRIRLGSLAPELVGADFVESVRGASVLAPHFHISIQSGSDRVLAAMKRRYTRARALEVIARIKKNIPRATFTTDIMVGFPGESEEDFLESMSFVREAGLLDAHVFQYSKREGTLAATYPDQVSEDVKHSRSERLIAEVARIRAEVLDGILELGEPMEAVIEQNRTGMWYGHTDTFVEVAVKSDADLRGKVQKVLPVTRKDGVLICEIV